MPVFRDFVLMISVSRGFLVVFCALLAAGCEKNGDRGGRQTGAFEPPGIEVRAPEALKPGEVSRQPLLERVGGAATLFSRVAPEESGLDFIHRWDPAEAENDRIATSFAGGGVALGDVDNDGLPDLFLTRPHGGSRLYRNLGSFNFRDATDDDGSIGSVNSNDRKSNAALFSDFDKDGDADLSHGEEKSGGSSGGL